MKALLAQVDWQRPWLEPYREVAARLHGASESASSVAELLNAARPVVAPIELAAGCLQFVPQSALPTGEPYETHIARTACVPTRDNLHDLFNGMVWLRFASIKRRLNALQAQQLAERGVQPTRGAVRDALTLFDESAALWQAPAVLADALRRRDWHALFVTHRRAWCGAAPVLFGHALIDRLTRPRKAITSHLWLVPMGDDIEATTLPLLSLEALGSKPSLPLPVLGVPGWWADNEATDFYADASVFRAPQR